MKLIICVDDNFGMMFNKRRQSQDRTLREKLIELCENSVLWMNEYSSNQFQNGIDTIVKLKDEYNCDVKVENEMISYAGADDYCFIENIDINDHIVNNTNEILLVKWNREYPSDMYFNKTYLDAFTLNDTITFTGYSHEEITIERYVQTLEVNYEE